MEMQKNFSEQDVKDLELFADKLEQAVDEAAVNSILKEYGYDTGAKSGDELGEADLENVTGGVTEFSALKWLLKNTDWGKLTWKGTKMAARCLYDAVRYGDPYRTYSEKEVQKVRKDLDGAMHNGVKEFGCSGPTVSVGAGLFAPPLLLRAGLDGAGG